MLVTKAGSNKLLVRIGNRDYTDKTASSGAVGSGSALFLNKSFDLDLHCLSRAFWQATSVGSFRTSLVSFVKMILVSTKYRGLKSVYWRVKN